MAKEDWKTIDREALVKAIGDASATDIWTAYESAKDAYRTYKLRRDVFEGAMQLAFADKLPEGMELKFGYNFGRLSIAVGPKTERAKAKAETGSLSDWLAEQASGGHRC